MSAPQKVQVFGIGAPSKGTPTAKRRYRVKWRIDDASTPTITTERSTGSRSTASIAG